MPKPRKSPPRRPVSSKSAEAKFYGVHACEAILEQRPQAIIRAYMTAKTKIQFRALMRWCVEHKLAYHIVTDEELERITASVHHEGVCILARPLPRLSTSELMSALGKKSSGQIILYLDGVGNPHNLGAILRTAANFNCNYIVGSKESLPELSPSACRIAEGAAEHVRLVECSNAGQLFKDLKRLKFQTITTDCHEGKSLFEIDFHSQVCLVIGAEVTGVSKSIAGLVDLMVRIPGSGKVESLNVGVATAIFVAEYFRQHSKVSISSRST